MILRLHLAETQDFSKTVFAKLKRHFTVSTGSVENKLALKKVLEEVDVFWFRLGYKIDNQVLSEASSCKFLVTPVTGLDHIDQSLCNKLGITIISLKGEFEFLKEVRATAEHTISLALSLLRKTTQAVNHAHSGKWNRDLFRGNELYKKRVGIIGLGRLGKIVAALFQAFGCDVSYYDRDSSIKHPPFKQHNSLEDCILENDIVSVHVDYSTQSHHLFDKKTLSHFNNKKWLINTSRGGIIDEEALLDCLMENKIAGVALDVLQGEPAVKDHPIISYARENENLILTPHIGGCTYESFEKTEAFILNKLLNFTNG